MMFHKGIEAGEQGWAFKTTFKKEDFYAFSPDQLEEDMSKQVFLEEAAVASVLHKLPVHFEL